MSASPSILNKRIEIWTSFSPEIKNALSGNIVAQGILLLLTGMILDGGVLKQMVGMAALAHWIAIFPILWRRPKTTDKLELGSIKIGFICFLPVSLFSMPLWGWLRELL